MVAPVGAVSERKVSQEALVTSLPLSMATMLLSCAPSCAEEAVAEATKEAADIMSENSGVLGYTNGGLVVAFSPLVIYGGEYRRVSKNKVAPRLDAHPLTRSPAHPLALALVRQCSICTARPSIPRQKFRIYCSWRRSAWWRPTSCRSPCSIVVSIDQHCNVKLNSSIILPRSCRSSLARPCSPAHARRGPARRATSS